MMRFDWRQYESDERGADWPALVTADPYMRYRECLGELPPWEQLVARVSDVGGEGQALEEACVRLFETFLATIGGVIRAPSRTCVFISHQRADSGRGCRVACLADHHGLDYWLDVHNPGLGFVNRLPPNDPRRSVLIAAIIEIGLLSSTHVIALHSASSLNSRWVPYELGRAKARKIASAQCAGWFEAGQTASTCGDYVHLAVTTHDEQQVAQWLHNSPGSVSCVVPATCTIHGTTLLT
jgi:hypothetical protein